MHEQGVVVAINSDDAEMGRRLNQEAAKGVKYGGMSEEEAWKMVTLNPAKLLHLDDRMGSLKVGKDADIVIWTDNPLSINSIVDYTIIDGAIFFDRSQSEVIEKRNQLEKARIISKMLKENKKGKKRLFKGKKDGHFHCNTIGEEASNEENMH
jgi:adenine deaminase